MENISFEELDSPLSPKITPYLAEWDKDYKDNYDAHQYKIKTIESYLNSKERSWQYWLLGERYLRKKEIELEILKTEQTLGSIWEDELIHYNQEYSKEITPCLHLQYLYDLFF